MYQNICTRVLLLLLGTACGTAGAGEEALRALDERVARLEQRANPTSAANAFNPAVSLILAGSYARLGSDPAIPATGFAMSANPAHQQGLNLGESELGISASIDPQFSGYATMALSPAGGVTVENAFVQTSALGTGLNLKAGRYFSGLGYLNEQHAHAWDFADQPLAYAVLWNNQLGEDGLQLKWLAPADRFVELGAEIGRGRGFPGSSNPRNGAGNTVLFAHLGDDIGVEHSWRAGVSLHQTRREQALSTGVPDLAGTAGGVSNSFTGDSRTAGWDMVWKYAPDGNVAERYVKFQSEYFRRTESGTLSYRQLVSSSYNDTQTGWYAQGVAQFMPHWRTGLRYDRLDPGSASVGAANAANVISNYAFQPTRTTWMLDYSPSEFARVRLQLARDHSRQALSENQIFLQYVMSMGAHGAHTY